MLSSAFMKTVPSDKSGIGSPEVKNIISQDFMDANFSKWIEAIVLIRKNQDETLLECQFPEDILSAQISKDLESTMMSVLQSMDNCKIITRIRDRSLPGFSFKDESDEEIGSAITNATLFYNCYLSVSSASDITTPSGTLRYKECVVIVSKWPFRNLFYEILDNLHEALELQTKPLMDDRISDDIERSSIFSSPKTAASSSTARHVANYDDETKIDDPTKIIISSALEVAYNQILSWPAITPGISACLTFFGNVLHCMIPYELVMHDINPPLTDMMLSINLLETLGTLGLIQHLWTIWEFLVTGQDIVIVATHPTHCCEIVLALGSLLEPMGHVGDIRPFITAEDKDLLILAATAQLKVVKRHETDIAEEEVEITTAFKKLAAKNRSMIVGVTEIGALSTLEDFSSAIFVDSTDFMLNLEKKRKASDLFRSVQSNNVDLNNEDDNMIQVLYGNYKQDISDSVFKGLRNRNAAIEKYLPMPYSSAKQSTVYQSYYKKKRGLARFFNFKSVSSSNKGSKSVLFSQQYEAWLNQSLEQPGQKRQTWLLFRTAPTIIPLQRIITRILRLHPDDRVTVGDKILRDNLQDISMAFVGENKDGDIVSNSDGSRQSIYGTLMDEEAVDELISQQRSLEMAREAEVKGMWRQGVDDIIAWLINIPWWIINNMGTVVLWIVYLVMFGALAWFGIPPVLIIITAYMVSIPEKAPDFLTHAVDTIIPLKYIFAANRGAALASPQVPNSVPSTSTRQQDTVGLEKKVPTNSYPDLNGTWKRVKVENYEAFLAAQGVSLLQRKIVTSIAMQHKIVIDECHTKLHLEEKGGPVELETDYEIDDQKFQLTKVLKAQFEDTVSWDFSYRSPEEVLANLPSSPKLLIKKKRLPDCTYELLIWRWIIPQSNQLRLRAVYHPLSSLPSKKMSSNTTEVESFCTFEYVGPAPLYVFAHDEKTEFNEEDYKFASSDSRVPVTEISLKQDLVGDDIQIPRILAPSNIVEEEILNTSSTDGKDIVYESPISSEKKRTSWLSRRRSSRSSPSPISKETHAAAGEEIMTKQVATGSKPSSSSTPRSSFMSPERQKEIDDIKSHSIDDSISTIEKSVSSKRPLSPYIDFSGIWIRTKTDNFEAFAEASGMEPLQRKVAAQMSLTHIITMDPPQLSVCRLQERGGPLNTDFTVTINSDHDVAVMMYGKRMLHRAWYLEANSLIMFRRADDGSFEHVLIRTLDLESSANRPQLILRSLHRDLHTGKEVEAISFFSKVGPSPNPPPLPQPELAHKTASTRKSFLSRRSKKPEEPTHSLLVVANDALPELEKEIEMDCDDDDDEIALKKMRSASHVQRERQKKAMKFP